MWLGMLDWLQFSVSVKVSIGEVETWKQNYFGFPPAPPEPEPAPPVMLRTDAKSQASMIHKKQNVSCQNVVAVILTS